MANQFLDQLITILQNLKTQTTNLRKDIDENDHREETKGDLTQIVKSFSELRAIMARLEQSDITKLQDELKQLMSGEESFSDYNRDVTNILLEVKRRIEKDGSMKEKIKQNMPSQEKPQDVGTLLDGWKSILSKVQNWAEQNSSSKIGR